MVPEVDAKPSPKCEKIFDRGVDHGSIMEDLKSPSVLYGAGISECTHKNNDGVGFGGVPVVVEHQPGLSLAPQSLRGDQSGWPSPEGSTTLTWSSTGFPGPVNSKTLESVTDPLLDCFLRLRQTLNRLCSCYRQGQVFSEWLLAYSITRILTT